MTLIPLIVAAGKALREWLREQACTDLLTIDDHALADLGLRRADLRAGLCQPSGMVDGDPPGARRSLDPSDFGVGWPLF
jgi:uncharacterized protein YjiS (DUF1127 family)